MDAARALTLPEISPPLALPPVVKEDSVAAASWFRFTYLAHFSRPKNVRQLYRLVKRHHICRIVEIGITDLQRSVSMVEVAQRYAAGKTVLFTGIDWFEARDAAMSPLSLKEAYRALHATGAKVRLAPGSPGKSLAAAANAHQHTDLILISARVPDSELESAWFYVPRMLHNRSEVRREAVGVDGEPTFERLTASEIAERAGQDAFASIRAGRRRAA
jgi:hypothetical protein